MGLLPRMNTSGRLAPTARTIVICVVVVALCVVVFPVRQVGVGERGVRYNRVTGRLHPVVLDSGWHLVVPVLQQATVYPITPRTYAIARDHASWVQGRDDSMWVPTSDWHRVNLDVLFTYRLDSASLHRVYQQFDGQTVIDIEKNYLAHIFKQAVISVVTGTTMADVYGEGRSRVQDTIQRRLNEALGPMAIDIELVLLSEVRLGAEAEAMFAAEARKRATVIEAEAAREANELIAQSLTADLVRLKVLEKLGSDLKVIMVPVTQGNFLELTDLFRVIEEVQAGSGDR